MNVQCALMKFSLIQSVCPFNFHRCSTVHGVHDCMENEGNKHNDFPETRALHWLPSMDATFCRFFFLVIVCHFEKKLHSNGTPMCMYCCIVHFRCHWTYFITWCTTWDTCRSSKGNLRAIAHQLFNAFLFWSRPCTRYPHINCKKKTKKQLRIE